MAYRMCDDHAHLKPLWGPPPADEYIPVFPLRLLPHAVQVVVVHAPCTDGFAAAVAAWRFNAALTIMGLTHAQLDGLHDELRGKCVLFVDIAPKSYERLMAYGMYDFGILDHHDTSLLALSDLMHADAVFDLNTSGCVLAWRYFFPDIPVPPALRVVEARDLWRKATVVDCDLLWTALNAIGRTCFYCWRDLLAIDTMEALQTLVTPELRAVEQDRQRRVADIAAGAAQRQLTAHGARMRAWVVNCTDAACTSDVGDTILTKNAGRANDVALMARYMTAECEWRVSVRSMGVVGRALMVARAYGGGGHAHAAAFTHRGSLEALFDWPRKH